MDFSEVVREAVAGQSLRMVAGLCGISYQTVSDMLSGVVPGRRIVIRFATGLKLSGDLRARLFRSAGYLDPAEPAGVA